MLGIVFFSRVRSALLCTTALWVLVALGILTTELVTCYLNGAGFDADVHHVLCVDVLFMIPLFLAAAFVFRTLAIRLTLFHLMKKQIGVSEHQPPAVLTPLEASLIVDNGLSFNKIAATIKDLELRGCIRISQDPAYIKIELLNDNEANSEEKTFLDTILENTTSFSTDTPTSKATLLAAGKILVQSVQKKLVDQSLISRNYGFYKAARILVNILIAAVVIVQLYFTVIVLLPNSQTFTIGYPRYHMIAAEPILELSLLCSVMIIGLSGFKQQALTDKGGLKNWRYVAALKVYIEKTYKDRFYRDGHQLATDYELQSFYPYAIAFGIERKFAKRLKSLLSL
jgi:hypothetical protein